MFILILTLFPVDDVETIIQELLQVVWGVRKFSIVPLHLIPEIAPKFFLLVPFENDLKHFGEFNLNLFFGHLLLLVLTSSVFFEDATVHIVFKHGQERASLLAGEKIILFIFYFLKGFCFSIRFFGGSHIPALKTINILLGNGQNI